MASSTSNLSSPFKPEVNTKCGNILAVGSTSYLSFQFKANANSKSENFSIIIISFSYSKSQRMSLFSIMSTCLGSLKPTPPQMTSEEDNWAAEGFRALQEAWAGYPNLNAEGKERWLARMGGVRIFQPAVLGLF